LVRDRSASGPTNTWASSIRLRERSTWSGRIENIDGCHADRDAAVIGAVAGFLIGVSLAMFWSPSGLVMVPVTTALGALIGFRFGALVLEVALRVATFFS
jgi:hypothetical protein